MKIFLNTAGTLSVMLLVIFLAYYVTKFVAVKSRTGFGKPRYFKLIDRFNISKDKMIVLVSVGQAAYLIGVTNQTVTLIDTIELSDIKQESPPDEMQSYFKSGTHDLSFRSLLNQVKGNTKKGNCGSDGENGDGDDDGK